MYNIVFVHAFPCVSVTFRPWRKSVTWRNVFIVNCHTRWRSLLVFERNSLMTHWVMSFRATFVVACRGSPAWSFRKCVCTTIRCRKFFWKCRSRRILKRTHSLKILTWKRRSLLPQLVQAHEETKLAQTTDAAGLSADPFSRQKPLSRFYHRRVQNNLILLFKANIPLTKLLPLLLYYRIRRTQIIFGAIYNNLSSKLADNPTDLCYSEWHSKVLCDPWSKLPVYTLHFRFVAYLLFNSVKTGYNDPLGLNLNSFTLPASFLDKWLAELKLIKWNLKIIFSQLCW